VALVEGWLAGCERAQSLEIGDERLRVWCGEYVKR
jgi:hypothetical protein